MQEDPSSSPYPLELSDLVELTDLPPCLDPAASSRALRYSDRVPKPVENRVGDGHSLGSTPPPQSTLRPTSRTLLAAEFRTNRDLEIVRVQRPSWLEGIELWTVFSTARDWGMPHDAYSAWLTLGPTGQTLGHATHRGVDIALRSGSTLLMQPGEIHRTTLLEKATFFVIWWAPGLLETWAREAGLSGTVHWKMPPIAPESAASSLHALYECASAEGDAPSIDRTVRAVTVELLASATEERSSPATGTFMHPGVRRAIDRLRDGFNEAISLDALAEEARLSKFHLSRCFREATGYAPHQYQRLLRVHAARRLLERGVSVEDAARRSGFADGPHLARAFRDRLGVSPGAWARAHKTPQTA